MSYCDKRVERIETLIDCRDIENRVWELGNEIGFDYLSSDAQLVVLCVLKGSFMFASDLMKVLHVGTPRMEFISASSYKGTSTTGTVSVNGELPNVDGCDVLIVEDIVDTGRTITKLVDMVKSCNPKSVKVCSLLDKPSRREVPFKPDYVGFSIENVFVVGYGMDVDEKFRELPYIGVLG